MERRSFGLDKKVSKQRLRPDILKIFKRITDEDCEAMGYNYWCKPNG